MAFAPPGAHSTRAASRTTTSTTTTTTHHFAEPQDDTEADGIGLTRADFIVLPLLFAPFLFQSWDDVKAKKIRKKAELKRRGIDIDEIRKKRLEQ